MPRVHSTREFPILFSAPDCTTNAKSDFHSARCVHIPGTCVRAWMLGHALPAQLPQSSLGSSPQLSSVQEPYPLVSRGGSHGMAPRLLGDAHSSLR